MAVVVFAVARIFVDWLAVMYDNKRNKKQMALLFSSSVPIVHVDVWKLRNGGEAGEFLNQNKITYAI